MGFLVRQAHAKDESQRQTDTGIHMRVSTSGRSIVRVAQLILQGYVAETGDHTTCYPKSRAARHYKKQQTTPTEWCTLMATPTPPPRKRTFGRVSSRGCTPRTPTAAAITRLAATRPPTPADAADAPNTNMRALRKGASVSSRRRVACEYMGLAAPGGGPGGGAASNDGVVTVPAEGSPALSPPLPPPAAMRRERVRGAATARAGIGVSGRRRSSDGRRRAPTATCGDEQEGAAANAARRSTMAATDSGEPKEGGGDTAVPTQALLRCGRWVNTDTHDGEADRNMRGMSRCGGRPD